MTPYNLVEDY